MTAHPIVAHAVEAYGCDHEELLSFVEGMGCGIGLEGLAGHAGIAHVAIRPGIHGVYWQGADVIFHDTIGDGHTRSVNLPMGMPQSVAAALPGQPLARIAHLPGDPGERIAEVDVETVKGRALITLVTDTGPHPSEGMA